YPYYQVARFAAPNLITGNPIILKHAPQCPESAAAVQSMYRDAGFPDGAYVNVYATSEQVATIRGDPRVAGASVTGSERAAAAAAETLAEQVGRAVAEGADLASSGERRGAYFPPGVLTGVTPDNSVFRQELFGPVAMVFKAADEDEAIALGNDTPFGLGSYVF